MKRIFLIVLLFSTSHLLAQLTSFEVNGQFPASYLTHQVKQGDQFLSLAKLYNLSPNAIASFNSLKLSETLNDRQLIKIPLTVSNFETYIPMVSNSRFLPLYRLLTSDETITSASRKTGIAEFYDRDIKRGCTDV